MNSISKEKLCCYLSILAYKTRDEIVRTMGDKTNKFYPILKSCHNINTYSSNIDAQCFTTMYDKKTMFLSFRGTESIRDWLSDANIIRVPMDLPNVTDKKRPRVHWGFLRQFRSVENDIQRDIQTFLETVPENERATLYITGHSLGAAQCSIAGLQFSVQYPQLDVMCYSYGSPRVGCDDFVNMFSKHVKENKRFVNEDDPVTMIPFAWRFTHLPGLVYLNEENQIINNIVESRWWSMLSDLFLSLCSGRENPIGDHSCSVYLDKLNVCLKDDDVNCECNEILTTIDLTENTQIEEEKNEAHEENNLQPKPIKKEKSIIKKEFCQVSPYDDTVNDR